MELKSFQVNPHSIQSCLLFCFHAVLFQSLLLPPGHPCSLDKWLIICQDNLLDWLVKQCSIAFYNRFKHSIFTTVSTFFVIIVTDIANKHLQSPTFLPGPCLQCISPIPLKVGMAICLGKWTVWELTVCAVFNYQCLILSMRSI